MDRAYYPLHEECSSDDGTLSVVRFFIENGVDVNEFDDSNMTPLHHACCANRPSSAVIQLLIKAGANVHAVNSRKETPLHCACIRPFATELFIETLIAGGSNVNQLNGRNRTPLQLICELSQFYTMFNSVDVIQPLIQSNARITADLFAAKDFVTVYAKCMQEKILTGIRALRDHIPNDLIVWVMDLVSEPIHRSN